MYKLHNVSLFLFFRMVSVPGIQFSVPDSLMDCDDLIFGTIYQVLLLVQSHALAEYASSLQPTYFTSYQDMVFWHVSIHLLHTYFIQA